MENKQCRERQTAVEAEHRGSRKDNLELYLNDVYEKECAFKIEDEEVEFITTGIETLVQDIVNKVLDYDTVDKQLGPTLYRIISMQDYIRTSLKEVYFPIRDGILCQSHKYAGRRPIIKVGSFYEGTRNGFPDEFDFTFFLYSCTRSLVMWFSYPLRNHIQVQLTENKLSFCYPPTDAEPLDQDARCLAEHNTCTTRRLYFDKLSKRTGPAFTLQFIYRSCDGQTRPIHVDLVPAEEISQKLESVHLEKIKPKSFREETLSAEGIIVPLGKHNAMSLTQTEVHFIRHLLSKKHKKVYRILKYLINGNGDEEKLKNCDENSRSYAMYSSYKIKTMIIYHHDECANSGTENIGPCVIQVLEELCKYELIKDFPQLISYHACGISTFCLFPYVKDLVKSLKTMQCSQDTYDYETHKIDSLSKQYLNYVILKDQKCNSQ